jgi:hypothetical protein
MKPFLARPLLGIAVSGALALGGVFIASPASAAPITGTVPPAADAAGGHTGGFVATPDRNAKPAPRRLSSRAGLAEAAYTVSTSAAWVGQTVSITELSASADTVTRTVNWGDGSEPVALAAGETVATKSYATPGSYSISVTLTDADGVTADASVDVPLVSISLPGRMLFSRSTVWPQQTFRLYITDVLPGYTSKIVLNWGDGWTETFPGTSGWVDSYYYRHSGKNGALISGKVTLTATFYSKLGTSSITGAVTVLRDSWRPTAGVTKPKNANRASAWNYVRGTAADKGAGLSYVYVWGTKITGKKVYCYTTTKKWKRVYNQAQLDRCPATRLTVSKGKWSLRVLGLKKGSTVYFDAISQDRADNTSKQATRKAKLTR